MSSGERPMGAAKGTQSDTEALCQPPPPPCALPFSATKTELPAYNSCDRLPQVCRTIQKTAFKFHYEFNLRHLSSIFQGVLRAQDRTVNSATQFIRLWLHECWRVYGDRLVADEDTKIFADQVRAWADQGGRDQAGKTSQYRGGKNLVREETCLEKFSTANSGAIFPIIFNDCGAIFPILFFGHQVQNLYLCWGGGGMIGGGECRIKYVMWMYGLVRFCVVCCEYCCIQHRVLSFRALQAAYHM